MTCLACKNGLLCVDHSSAKDVIDAGYEGVWWIIRKFLSLPNNDSRQKGRKVLIRRLIHAEMGPGSSLTVAKMPKWDDPKSKPFMDSPMCICGQRLKSHDQLSGECSESGCEMYCPVP